MANKVLIVYAHQYDKSFNAALRDVAVRTLRNDGHDVIVSDLYAMNFNPITGKGDIKGLTTNGERFDYAAEIANACAEGRVADDIRAEQDKVKAADLVIFQFPLYWMGFPAILKGWFDRTFTHNFAFTDTEIYDEGRLKGKRAILSMTTGAPESFFNTLGPNGDINVLLWPLQNGILRFVGFDVLAPFITYSPQLLADNERANILEHWQARLLNVFEEKPLRFIDISRFYLKDTNDPLKGVQLTEETIKELEEDKDRGLTIGHHLGRKVPLDSMTKPTH